MSAHTRHSRRQLLTLIASAVPTVALLAACGGGGAPAAPAPAQATSAPAPAAAQSTSAPAPQPTSAVAAPTAQAATGTATVTFHARLGVQADHFTAMAKVFMQQNPNIVVKGEYFPGAQYDQKVQVLVAGGTLGDAMWNASITGFGPLAVKGVLIDHGPLIASTKFDLTQLFPQAVSGVHIGGKAFGLPWIVHPGRVGLYYNKPMFDQAKLTYPDATWTYDRLHTTAKQLTKVANGRPVAFGFLGADQPWGVIVFIRSFGSDYLSPDGKTLGITAPPAIAAIQSLADFYGKEKSAPVPTEIEGGSPQMFASNQLAMFQSGYWGISQNYQYAKKTPWGVSPMPLGTAGMKGMFEFDPVSVTKFSKSPQAAFSYLAFLTSQLAGIDIAKRGSVPGSRISVWSDPVLMKDVNHVVFAKIIKTTPPLLMPANFRALEFADAMTKGMDPLLIGKETDASKVVKAMSARLQGILDEPVG